MGDIVSAIRVLRVINSFNGGGIDNSVLEHLARCREHDVRVDVLCVGGSTGRNSGIAEDLGAHVLLARKHPVLSVYARRVQRVIRDRRYEIVMTNLSLMGAAPLMAARKEGVQVRVGGFHSSQPNTLLQLERWRATRALRSAYLSHLGRAVHSSATALFCVGEAVEHEVRLMTRGAPLPLARIPRGFDLRQFAPPPAALRQERRTALGLQAEDLVVAHAGAFKPEKNHAMLLDIVRLAANEGRRFVLMLLGEGNAREDVLGRASAADLRTIAPGNVGNVPEWLGAADVFLFPSVREGLPGAVVEAQACGLPVVCSNIPENLEALAPVWHPYAFDLASSPRSAAARLLALLRLVRAQQSSMVAEARAWVETNFDADVNITRLDSWLHALAADGGAAGFTRA